MSSIPTARPRRTTSSERWRAIHRLAASPASRRSGAPFSAGRRETRSRSACRRARSLSPSKRSSKQSMSVRRSDEGTAARELNPESIADRTTVGVFFRQAARFGDRPLVHYPTSEGWKVATWADTSRNILAISSALVEADIKPGDHVVLMGPNSLEWLYCDFAIQAAGAIAVPIYAGTVPEVAQAIAANCEAVMAIISDAKMTAMLTTSDTLRRIVRMDVEVARWVSQPPQRQGEVIARLERIRPDDVCTIVYTSGTTGDPKGAELAHRNLVDTTQIGRAHV